MAAQTHATLQVQQQMQAQFQQYQESQQVILEGIRQQQEAADAPTPDDDLSDVHFHVWMPR
jgi:hypothetical protein